MRAGTKAAARASSERMCFASLSTVAQHDQENHVRAAGLLLCLLLDRHRLEDLLDISWRSLRGSDHTS
jgi:hypothetical protein